MKFLRKQIRSSQFDGFSLIELLVVIAIVAILMVLTVPALNSVSVSRTLDTAGREVLDQLSIARQHAMTFGRRVRWELLELDGPGGKAYRAHRLMEFKNGGWSQVGRWRLIPEPVQLNLSTTRSSLLGQVGVIDSVNYQGATQSSVNFLGITFLSDGTTLLPPAATHPGLTLEVPRGGADASGNYPNWVAIVVNPVTGTAESYRP